MNTISNLVIIPARYNSSRFPGKPLVEIGGKPMIAHVYQRAKSCIGQVIVATDDERILKAVEQYGGEAVMTSDQQTSGTDRCAEALSIYETSHGLEVDVVINIQGDEPFIRTDQIELLRTTMQESDAAIATLIKPITDQETLHNPNRPKAVIDREGYALYFSRTAIPYVRSGDRGQWHRQHQFYQHLGAYAYKSTVLKAITRLTASALEQAESLEQLRWLENGYRIMTAVTPYESFGIDTPDDLERIRELGFDGKIR